MDAMIMSLGDLIRKHGSERPDAIAITFHDRDITYGELEERSSRVAQGLLGEGVSSQEHIAFIDKNSPAYFEVLYGGGKVNAINVAVNWRLAAPEMAYVVNDAQAKVVFVGEEFFPQLDDVEGQLTTVKKIVTLGRHPKHESYDDWVSRQDATDPRVPSDGEDVCMQLYTSGTTGLPKGAMLTNNNFFPLVRNVVGPWFFDEQSVNIVVMPLFHIAGCAWGIIGNYMGVRNILLRDVIPSEILQSIPRYGVTNAIFVPAVLQFLLMTPGVESTDLSTLRAILYGASPITEDILIRSMQTFGCKFIQVYGLTETTGAITQLDPEDHDPGGPRANLLRSCGKPYPWLEIKTVDPATEVQTPPGTVGEIWVRGPQNMKGYWGMPAETAKTIRPDGWLRSGDAGYFDEDGFLFIHDRVKDMIISGGENIYPAEVENALMAHPDIADVAVIGIPSEKWGESVKAVVVRASGSQIGDKEIIEFARSKIAHYKCPTSVDFAEALPRNPSGKLLKREIREPYWEGIDRRVH
jgi:long-chain acyl-CoA synthetase